MVRTYGAGPIPIGSSDPISPLAEAGGAYNSYSVGPYGLGGAQFCYAYDGTIPPSAPITSITKHLRWAAEVGTESYVGSSVGISINTTLNLTTGALNNVGGTFISPITSFVALGAQPADENWVEGKQEHTGGGLGAFTEAQLRTGIFSNAYAVLPPNTRYFMDALYLTVVFSLPLPTIPSGPSFFSTTRNSTELSNTLSAAAGISNSTYPLTVRTRYTQSDPASAGSQDEGIGQGQIFETAPQTVFSADAAARNIDILDSITGLLPNTTYYAQTRCENADGDIVDSAWTSFTTRQFDTVLSF